MPDAARLFNEPGLTFIDQFKNQRICHRGRRGPKNLYGNVIEKRNDALPYRNTNVYYQRIGGIINNFAADVEKKHGKVLGVSFAIQGILSPRQPRIFGVNGPLGSRSKPWREVHYHTN